MRSWVLLMALGAGAVFLAVQSKPSAWLRERTDTTERSNAMAVDPIAVNSNFTPISPMPTSLEATSDAPLDFSFGPYSRYRHLSEAGGYYQSYYVVAVGDMTADGRDDVITLPSDNEIHLLVQQENGELAEPRIFVYGDPVYSHPKELVLADFNEDGVLDVASSSLQGTYHFQGGLNLLLSDGQGGVMFRQELGDLERSTTDWSVLDVDLDGHLDIVGFENVTDYSEGAECGNTQFTCPRYRIMHGDGKGGFGRVATVQIGQPYSIAGAGTPDLNGDGHADLAFVLLGTPFVSGKVMAQYHDGHLGLLPPIELHAGPDVGGSVVFGDLNADGRIDSALAHADFSRSREVRLRNATGAYSAPLYVPGYLLRSPFLVSDFDGDGDDDVASVQMAAVSGGYVVFGALNLQKTGVLAPPLISDPFHEANYVSTQRGGSAAGDVNGDGCQDFVFAASYEGIIVLPGQNCIPAPARRTAPPVSDDSGYQYLWTGSFGATGTTPAQAIVNSGPHSKSPWQDMRCDGLARARQRHLENASAASVPTPWSARSVARRKNCSGPH